MGQDFLLKERKTKKKIYIFYTTQYSTYAYSSLLSRLFQYIGGYKNVYKTPTLCFMHLYISNKIISAQEYCHSW